MFDWDYIVIWDIGEGQAFHARYYSRDMLPPPRKMPYRAKLLMPYRESAWAPTAIPASDNIRLLVIKCFGCCSDCRILELHYFRHHQLQLLPLRFLVISTTAITRYGYIYYILYICLSATLCMQNSVSILRDRLIYQDIILASNKFNDYDTAVFSRRIVLFHSWLGAQDMHSRLLNNWIIILITCTPLIAFSAPSFYFHYAHFFE